MAKKWMIQPGGQWAIPASANWQIGDEGDLCCCAPNDCLCGGGDLTAVFSGMGGVGAADNGTFTVPYIPGSPFGSYPVRCVFSATIAGTGHIIFIIVDRDDAGVSGMSCQIRTADFVTQLFFAQQLDDASPCEFDEYDFPTNSVGAVGGSAVVTR